MLCTQYINTYLYIRNVAYFCFCLRTYVMFSRYHLKARCRDVVHFSALVTSHNFRRLCQSYKKEELFVCFLWTVLARLHFQDCEWLFISADILRNVLFTRASPQATADKTQFSCSSKRISLLLCIFLPRTNYTKAS
jgi:hypothetical protein